MGCLFVVIGLKKNVVSLNNILFAINFVPFLRAKNIDFWVFSKHFNFGSKREVV